MEHPEVHELRRAISSLRLEVDRSIANDISEKAEAVIALLKEEEPVDD